MKTSEIKKGMRILLSNGWYGTMMDNMRGTTRLAEVEGYYTEMGSVYSYDIVAVEVNGQFQKVDYTEKELKLKKTVAEYFS
jgi:hypothetical protein